MTILVTHASRSSSTAEIAQAISETLTHHIAAAIIGFTHLDLLPRNFLLAAAVLYSLVLRMGGIARANSAR